MIKEEHRDKELLVKGIFATVGLVQIVKNLVNKGGAKVWTFATVIAGIVVGGMIILLPANIVDCLLIVCGATLFYDTVYKAFEKVIKLIVSKITEKGDEENECDLRS